ncbi:MAG TPA: dTDP-4-dehydrorhamnose 3,5-epimerase family protein [Candidatus Saccharimonadales bacterium]|nr:dTDP-4-dehydrorhamnose 3,5-epimerase family protein [Candidatus Saccharimonadales bacterium]
MQANNWQPVSQNVEARATSIPGLIEFKLDVRGDNRGWFKENYQREKLVAALENIDDPRKSIFLKFNPIQNNFSYNEEKGVARGIHSEPWDKYISLANGEAFAAIVDLRQGETFGKIETFHLTPNNAIFVPQGCGNSYQTLTPNLVYTYLVNAHWSPDAKYTFVNLRDPDLAIKWPIPLNDALISEKDRNHPLLKDVKPLEVS